MLESKNFKCLSISSSNIKNIVSNAKTFIEEENFENPIDIMIFYLTKPENIQPIVDIPQDLNYSLKNKNFVINILYML